VNDKLIHSVIVISLPTFIISECVLIYLDPDSSRRIVGWASQTFSTAIFFLYEQVTTFIISLFYYDYYFHGNEVGSFLHTFNRSSLMMLLGSRW